ncbi:hypothetical protein Tco_0570298 [Tanacetum coccineum]
MLLLLNNDMVLSWKFKPRSYENLVLLTLEVVPDNSCISKGASDMVNLQRGARPRTVIQEKNKESKQTIEHGMERQSQKFKSSEEKTTYLRGKTAKPSSCIHDTFHVSNHKKCLAEPDAQVPLEEVEIHEHLRFVKKPIEIVGRDVKKLKRRRIPLVKVCWNSRQGAEYTWECEDQFRKKNPHLFSKPVPSSSVAA